MLMSIGLILIFGWLAGAFFEKVKLPSLLGMMAVGVIIGPYFLQWLDPSILAISSDIRKAALVIILMRAGLQLNVKDLKKVGREALMICFIPATLEIVGIALFAPLLTGIGYLEAVIMGCVLAAVSPAVVLPRMIRLMDEGVGTEKKIPQMLMAGASIDDIYVIVLFSSFLEMYQRGSFSGLSLLQIPMSIILGALLGVAAAFILMLLFKKINLQILVKICLVLGVAFLLVSMESVITAVAVSGLLAVMAFGMMLFRTDERVASEVAKGFNQLWFVGQIFLFVLVGAAINVQYLGQAGMSAVWIVLVGSLFRMLGVWLALLGTHLSLQEKLFCCVAYLPKATVQAAIGGVPLAMGVPAGELIFTVSVVSILITAPIGAIGIDYLSSRWLK